MKLRDWQSNCINQALKKYSSNKTFTCLATPGAGKTLMSAVLANKLIKQNEIDYIFCFSPSISTVSNIQATFENVLERPFNGLLGAVGNVYTYQSLFNISDNMLSILANYRVLLVLDEIHHCGGQSELNYNAWGRSIDKIGKLSEYVLTLSGTPWRTDNNPITLYTYDPTGKLITDYSYGLVDAIADEVCRVPNVILLDNREIKLTSDTKKRTYKSFSELVKSRKIQYSEVLFNRAPISRLLKTATKKLSALRCEGGNAAGLVVASSLKHAEFIKNVLENTYNQTTVTVNYKHKDAQKKIREFSNTDHEWIISIGMVSEGTDIPRLQVCCHLTNIRTELHFRQVLGRVLRKTNSDVSKGAWLYSFAEPKILEFTEQLKLETPKSNIVVEELNIDLLHTSTSNKGLPSLIQEKVDENQSNKYISEEMQHANDVVTNTPESSLHSSISFSNMYHERMFNVLNNDLFKYIGNTGK